MLILQAFLLNEGTLAGVLSTEENTDQFLTDTLLLKIAFGTTILSIFSAMTNNYVEAKAVQEPFILYTL